MSLLRVVTAGSVDDGKSTLVGRLLYDSRAVMVDQMSALEEASERLGYDGVRVADPQLTDAPGRQACGEPADADADDGTHAGAACRPLELGDHQWVSSQTGTASMSGRCSPVVTSTSGRWPIRASRSATLRIRASEPSSRRAVR